MHDQQTKQNKIVEIFLWPTVSRLRSRSGLNLKHGIAFLGHCWHHRRCRPLYSIANRYVDSSSSRMWAQVLKNIEDLVQYYESIVIV